MAQVAPQSLPLEAPLQLQRKPDAAAGPSQSTGDGHFQRELASSSGNAAENERAAQECRRSDRSGANASHGGEISDPDGASAAGPQAAEGGGALAGAGPALDRLAIRILESAATGENDDPLLVDASLPAPPEGGGEVTPGGPDEVQSETTETAAGANASAPEAEDSPEALPPVYDPANGASPRELPPVGPGSGVIAAPGLPADGEGDVSKALPAASARQGAGETGAPGASGGAGTETDAPEGTPPQHPVRTDNAGLPDTNGAGGENASDSDRAADERPRGLAPERMESRPALEIARIPVNQGTQNAALQAAPLSMPALRAGLAADGQPPAASVDESPGNLQSTAPGQSAGTQAPAGGSLQAAPDAAASAHSGQPAQGPGSIASIEDGDGEAILQTSDRSQAAAGDGAETPGDPNAVRRRPPIQRAAQQLLPITDAGNTAPQTPLPTADALTQTLTGTREHGAVTVRFGASPQSGQPMQIPANSIALQIARNFENGVNRFQIRIDPPELGRVDVRLDMSVEGRAHAHLTVERAETLDLLQRDARALERALSDAGLNADKDSLSFSLRDQGQFSGSDTGQNAADASADMTGETGSGADGPELQFANSGYVTDTGIDIRV